MSASPVDELEVAILPQIRPVLGEGPSYDSATQLLYWVDIKGSKLHIFNPVTKEDREIATPKFIGVVVPNAAGGLVAGLADGIYSVDLATETFERLSDPDQNAANRFNDGKVDPRGRFWAGTMDDSQSKAAGNMWVFDPKKGGLVAPRKAFDGIWISNGLAWSPDHKTFYYIDTPLQRVDAFDYDVESGEISNRRTVITLPPPAEGGYPDGMTIDVEGNLWVAHWEGSKVTRWNPNTGTLLRTVSIPVSKVTSATFGGPKLDQLYITTASVRSDVEKEPLAGAVFVLRNPGTTGFPAIPYGVPKV